MKNKKIKIFLGGYVNSINAQNLNCLSLARYLNKEKYEIYTMVFKKGDFDLPSMPGVKFWIAYLPFRIYKYILRLKAIFICDILYLPKGDMISYSSFLLKLFRKKSFLTIEGVFSGSNYMKMLAKVGSLEKMSKYYSHNDYIYSISSYMNKYNEKNIGIKSDGILYLGVDTSMFECPSSDKNRLLDIIFIGNNMRDKGIEDFLEISAKYPQLNFHIVGGGLGVYDPYEEVNRLNLKNVTVYGSLNHKQLSAVLPRVQLMFFPSRSEGFPKVILETAAAGIPSIVYSDYGADEWVTTGKDGFVVKTTDEVSMIINDLMKNPDKIQVLSQNAINLAKRFDWKVVINDWEREIDKMVKL